MSIGVCLQVCLYTMHMPCARRGQKGVLDPLVMELLKIVGHHLGAKNKIHVLWKNAKCLQLLNHLSTPSPFFNPVDQ